MKKNVYDLPCNIAHALNIIGDRWTLLIAKNILVGKTTFNELKEELRGISANILSDRLRTLEEQGLVVSELYSAHPPRYRYQLTESGRELEMVFNSILLWGRRNLEKCFKKIEHNACGHEVEIAYYCPHCEGNVADYTVKAIGE
ncbi:MAG: transcriptional regulator, HxlR family protein [Paenibacillaceae bacterium]|jgi:DNA-binding HxlR family transcriptional regulator|nr:transcriptional regulator, HxlR family protein [Paenibacillaceae bacterium]